MTIAELTAVITADTSDFDSKIDSANQKLNELGKSSGSAGEQLNTAGKMMAGIGAAMTAPLLGAVKQAADFEYAMSGVNAALGGVDTETMDLLEQQARELGSSSQYSATEVAAVQQELAKTGLTAEQLLGSDGLGGATKAVLDLAAATGEELVPSANLVANAMQSFGLKAEDTTRIADIFTSSLNQSAMSIPDLQRGLNYLGPAMASLDKYTQMTAEGLNGQEEALIDANAALALFNRRGLKAANTGVSLARLFDELADPTSDAAAAMEQYGIEAFDTQGRMKDLPDLLDEIGGALDGLSDEDRIKAIGAIFGQQSKDVVDQMVRAFKEGGLGDEFRDIADGMREEGLAAKQAQIRQDNLLGSVEKLGGALNDLGIAMGKPLIEPIKGATDVVTEMINALAGAPEPVQRLVSEFGLLAGGLLTFGGGAAWGTGKVLELGASFAKAGLSLPKFAAGLGLVGLAIGAGLLAYETNFLGFGDFVDEKMTDAGNAVETFGRVFDEVLFENRNAELNQLAAGIAAFGTAWDAATGMHISQQTRKMAEAVQRFADAYAKYQDIGERIGRNAIASDIAAIGHAIDSALGTDIAPYFERAADAVQAFGDEWQRARSAGLDPFTSALLGTRDALGSLFDVDLTTPLDNFGAALNSGREGVVAFKDDLLAGDWDAAWDGLMGGLDSLGIKFDDIDLEGKLQGVSDQLTDWFDSVGDLLMGREALGPGDKGAIEGLLPKLADDLTQGITELPALVGDKLEEVKFAENLGGVKDQFTEWFSGLGDELFGAAAEDGGFAVEGLIPRLADDLTQEFANLPTLVGQKLGELPFAENLGGIKDQFGQWIGDIKDLLVGEGSQFAEDRGAIEGGLIPQLADAIATGFQELPDLVSEKMGGNPFEALGPWLAEQVEQLPDTLGPVKESVLSTGREIGDDLFNSLLDGIAGKQDVGDMYNPSAIKPRTELIKDGLGAMVGDFMGAAEEFAYEVTRSDPETVRAAKDIGQTIGSGMVDLVAGGIRDAFKEPLSPQQKIAGSDMYNPSAMAPSDGTVSWGDAFEGFASGMWDGMQQNLEKEWTESVEPGLIKWSQEKMFDIFNPSSPLGMPNIPFLPGLVQGVGAAEADDKNNKLGAALGESFGQTLGAAMASDKFQQKFEQALRKAPEEVYSSIGGAFLGKINQGMARAMQETEGTGERVGHPLGQGLGQEMVETLATGLQKSLDVVDPTTFAPAGTALGQKMSAALGLAMMDTSFTSPTKEGEVAGGGVGELMTRSLASGLSMSLQNAKPEIFQPVGAALGQQLNNGLFLAMQAADLSPEQIQGGMKPGSGIGELMTQSLATGLTQGITNAKPETFTPVASALGTQLGAAMSLAAQQTQPPGGIGPAGPAVPAMGQQMVQGLATGLTNGITEADPALFVPVSNALGTQLGAAMGLAAQQAAPSPGLGGVPGQQAAGGIGSTMVQGLAQGLTDSITNAPPEFFTPVAGALGTQLSTAMQTAMGTSMAPGPTGVPTQVTGFGQQMVQGLATGLSDSITNAPAETFQPVGDALGAKMSEALQVVASGEGATDVSEQIGVSMGQMLEGSIRDADFAGVGDQLTTQLSDQMGQAIEDVSSEISDQMSQITEAIGEAVEQMGEAISQATESVSSAVEDMSGAIEDAVGAVSDAVTEMSSAVEEAAGQMEEAASSAAEAAGEVGDAAAEAAEAVSQAMSEMAASVQQAAGAIEGAAGQIVAALNSIAAAAGSAGAAIGAALAGGFSSELGIASPSKVFLGFGKNIVEGLAIGMGGNHAIMTRGSQALAKQSMTTLADAIGMGSPAKKFMPHGRAITDGMLQGMLQQAKGRLQSVMGQMSGAVESGMGKVRSAAQSGMDRVRSEGNRQARAAGADAAAAHADGMSQGEGQAERAARRLWRRAYRELMSGAGAARFLGEAWAREFWEGMLDSSGSLAFAQYVTTQIVNAAENAVTAALGKVQGLGTQLAIVADAISTLQGEVDRLTLEDQQLSSQAQQQRLAALQEEVRLQQQITQELENRLKTEVSAAHLAHIRAVQTRSVAAQADYEAKLRTAQATDTARAEAQIRADELAATLDAMQQAIALSARAELAERRAAVAEELALARQSLAAQEALQGQLLAAQTAAQLDYTQAVMAGSAQRIRQLRKELRDASGVDQRKTLQAQIALEQQRIALAQQLATAIQQQAGVSDPETLAQTGAQVQFLTAQIEALGQVDVGSLLQGIVSELGTAASALTSAAGDLGTAAAALGSADASAGMSATASAAGTLGQQIEAATGGMFSMGAKYHQVMDQMAADGYAFQAQFKAMTEKVRGDAATEGDAIGLSLTDGIAGRIEAGGPALQQTMLAGLQQGVEATETAAGRGGDAIATAFGDAMRGELGVQLPQVHQDILGSLTAAVDETAKEAAQGGVDIAAAYGQSSTDKLKDVLPKMQTAMSQPISDGVSDARKIASQGGKDIASVLTDGLKLGITAKGGVINNATAKIVRDAVQAARDEAKAKSPSLKMIALGHDMGDGLIIGLGDRESEAEDASSRLVHIPLSPTSSGGVTRRRAASERGNTIVHIEHLELPSVTNPYEFLEALEHIAASDGVSSGR